jgi:hypothetical protein
VRAAASKAFSNERFSCMVLVNCIHEQL